VASHGILLCLCRLESTQPNVAAFTPRTHTHIGPIRALAGRKAAPVTGHRTSVRRRDSAAWATGIFERKLDGERCLAFRSGTGVRLMTRNRKDDTSTYPEITQALAAQRAGEFIIDGEIVAFDGSQTRFARLQQRLGVRHPGPDLTPLVITFCKEPAAVVGAGRRSLKSWCSTVTS